MTKNPKFPSCSLESALDYAKKAYENIGGNTVDSDTFIECMGYRSRSGASVATLAALRHYDLLTGRGESVQLSELFMRIILPLDEDEKSAAIAEAATSPEMFAELFNEFSPLPPNDLLKSLLIRKYNFNEKNAKRFVSYIKETEVFASNLDSALSSAGTPDEVQEQPAQSSADDENAKDNSSIGKPEEQSTTTNYAPPIGQEVMRFKLSKDSEAEVHFFGELNSKTIRHLISHLELTATIYNE